MLLELALVEGLILAFRRVAVRGSDQAPVSSRATRQATSVGHTASLRAPYGDGENANARVSFNGRLRTSAPFSLVVNTAPMRSHGIECPIPATKVIAEYGDLTKAKAANYD